MVKEQLNRVESALLETVERLSKTATNAAEVEALAAVVLALVEVHRC